MLFGATVPGSAQPEHRPAGPKPKDALTYLMLFRVGVVTLLLITTFVTQLGGTDAQPASPRANLLFALIAATYGLTIVFALWLKRARRVARLAATQLATDLVLTSLLVQLTGGAESGFAFMYLLVVVSTSFVLDGGALIAAGGAIACYAAAVLLSRAEVLPAALAGGPSSQPLREVLRVLLLNAIAFAATGALSARLARELKRAGEREESTGLRLRDLAALHEDVIRSLSSGLITLQPDGEILTLNRAAGEILGLKPARALGQRIEEIIPQLGQVLAGVPGDSPLRRGEVPHRGADGRDRTLGVSVSPLTDASGQVRGRIVSFQDLTELRRMEQAVARAERLAAVGRLAAGVAHEIRNPLQAISGSIELLAQTSDQPRSEKTRADQKELMDIALREIERLNALITDLLGFARPRPPEPQRLDLECQLADLMRVFQHDKQLGGARVELRARGPVWVEADPAQLRQVVWNLVRNACEASPDGAPVTVELASGGDEPGGRVALITVRDRGPGIPPEHRARLFEPFFSTKEGGTGLGLATVHRIVEEHRGRIEVEVPGGEGGGTAITVRLPLAAPAA